MVNNNSGVMSLPEASVELHAHPFLSKNRVIDVAFAIENNKLDVAALEALDASIFEKVSEEIQKYYPGTIKDNAGIRFGDGNYCSTYNDELIYHHDRFILNAREYTTKEGFHLLTIGHSIDAKPETEIRKLIDEGLKNEAFVVIAHPFVDNVRTKTAGHISRAKEADLTDLCEEYQGHIALEWNGYCVPSVREKLMGFMNAFGEEIEYYDVNHKVYDFAYSPEILKLNIPLVPGTDLHAVNKRHLSAIGTSRMWVDVEGETPSDILYSMIEHVFDKEHKFVDSYVSAPHVIGAFCIPLLKEIISQKKSKE